MQFLLEIRKLAKALTVIQFLCSKERLGNKVIVELKNHLPPLIHEGNMAGDERKSFICC